MNITTILILVLAVAAVIGAVVGVIKGYSKTSFWGATVVLTVLLERWIGGLVKKGSSGYALATLISAVAALLVLTLLFAAARGFIDRNLQARKKISEYRIHDQVEENEQYILNALDNNDKKEYKRLRKERKKMKIKAGGWGVADRILGLIFGLINACVGVGVVLFFVVLFVDFSQIALLNDLFGVFLSSPIWLSFGARIAFDVLLISLLSLAIRSGYKCGVSSFFCTLVILALIAVFGYASYHVASSEACSGMVAGLSDKLLANLPEALADYKPLIATIILTAIFFLFSLIIVIIVGIFLPKLVDRFRESKIYSSVDGVFGAIVLCVFVFGLLLVAGGAAYTLSDMQIMSKLNSYMGRSHFADCLYAYNPLGGLFTALPLRGWFGESASV